MNILRRMHWFFVAIPVLSGLFVIWSLATASVEPQRLGGPFVYQTTPEPVKTSLSETGTPTPIPYVMFRDNLTRQPDQSNAPLPTDKLISIARDQAVEAGLQGEATEERWQLFDEDQWAGIYHWEVFSDEAPVLFIYSLKGEITARYHMISRDQPRPREPEALSVILDATTGQPLGFVESYLEDPVIYGVEQSRPYLEYLATQTHVWATETMAATLYGTPTPTATRVKRTPTADIPPEKSAER